MSDELIQESIHRPENREEIGKTERDLLPPVGWYVTVPALTLTYKSQAEGVNAGRVGARYFGEAHQTVKRVDPETGNEKEVIISARLGFGMSHERANWPGSQEPDAQTKLYIQARRAYIESYGVEPETPCAVYEFVRDYPVVVRVIQKGVPTERNPTPKGEPRVDVVSISVVREK